MPSKEVLPFSCDFKHAHVAGQFAGFTFGCSGVQPNIRSLGAENRSELLMRLSARPASPLDSALVTH